MTSVIPCVFAQSSTLSTTINYYVSPNGSDDNDDSLQTLFKTLGKAREVVRTVNNSMTGDINVNIMDGTYTFEDTLTFTPEDSGNNVHRVIYKAYDDAKPVFSGRVDISDGWTMYNAEKGIYQKTGIDWDFRQLYTGGDRAIIDYNHFYKNAGGGVTMGMAGDRWDDDEGRSDYRDMDGQSVYDTITNNTIDMVACDYKDMVGIGAMLPQHMTIANNEVSNLPYTGINLGWNRSDKDHGMTDNQVYSNYIYDVTKLLQDGGGIYTLGRMDGDSLFSYNYITNIVMSGWAPRDNLMGIYFDNGSCYKKAMYNIIDNTVYPYQASNPPNHDNIFERNFYNCPKGLSSTASNACTLNEPFDPNNKPEKVEKSLHTQVWEKNRSHYLAYII